MREIDYTDSLGRTYRVRLPDNVSDEHAQLGIPIGPPDVVDALGLPEPFATRLHNELHRRKLWRLAHVRANPRELQAALQAALKVDAQVLETQYALLERLNDPEVLPVRSRAANGTV